MTISSLDGRCKTCGITVNLETHSCTLISRTGFTTKDSGKRQEFDSGMKRDITIGKIRYDLVDMPMFKRWAELMTRGAIKYEANNWKKANSYSELERFKESAFRHFMDWFLEDNQSEDHAAATYFNIAGCEFVKQKLKEKKNG